MEEALSEYEGTLLFVSHDRYFIDKVANRILYFHKKRWINFHGNYSQFMSSKNNLISDEKEESSKKRVAHEKMAPRQRNKKKLSLEDVEKNIIDAESRLKEITELLGTEEVYQNPERVKELKSEYDETNLQLAEWNKDWENLVNEASKQS